MKRKYEIDYSFYTTPEGPNLTLEIYNQCSPFIRPIIVMFPRCSIENESVNFSLAQFRPYNEPRIPFSSARFNIEQKAILRQVTRKILGSDKIKNRKREPVRGQTMLTTNKGGKKTPKQSHVEDPPFKFHASRREISEIERMALLGD